MSVFTALNKLKTNIFGGPGNTGFTKPPSSLVQDIGITPSPTGLLEQDPLHVSTFSYPLDVQSNFQNGHYMLFYVNVQNKTKYKLKLKKTNCKEINSKINSEIINEMVIKWYEWDYKL